MLLREKQHYAHMMLFKSAGIFAIFEFCKILVCSCGT